MSDLERAQMLLRDGNVEQAVAALHQILEADPDDADALYLSGTIAWQLKFHDQAIELYEQAVEVRPDFADAHLMLGNALGDMDRADEALVHWRRAIVLRPGNARAHGNVANALGKRGDHAGAVESAQRAINIDPTLAGAHMILGAAHQIMGRPDAAEPPLREATRLEPDNPEFLNALASLLIGTERAAEAEQILRGVLARHPNDVRARRLAAEALMQTGEYAAAEQEMLQLTANLPDWAEGWIVLAMAQRSLGRFDQAVASLQRALVIDPDNVEAFRTLSAVRRGAAEQPEIDRLNALLANPSLRLHDRAEAAFALGKMLDDDGQFDAAFAAFAVANAAVHSLNSTAGDRFMPATLRMIVRNLIGAFDPAMAGGVGAGADPTDLPVFIVGMPRSGTTLVEQIVASHSLVFGAGELTDIPKITLELRGADTGPVPRTITEAGVAAARAAGAVHLQRLRGLGGTAVRVTDKLPDNIFHLGTIAAVYPCARVILVRRDPRDTCLSCFFQRFGAHNVMYSYDLAECGHWAVAVDQVAEHWRAALPLQIIEVRYEELVADLEGQSRRLIEFLGLEWEPGCLDFHRTDRAIATASAWQARQPLYHQSVGRWRNYQRHLGPLLGVLRTRWPEM